MKTLRHALVFISALLGTSSLHAAPGDLDLSFGGGGKVTTAIGTGGDFGYSVIQQADGKLVVAGIAGTAAMMMLRWCATTPMAPWIPALMGMAKSPQRLVRSTMKATQ
jgi:hypothetical protein